MIQTRSEENGLMQYIDPKHAFEAAEKDKSIWKISFSLPNGTRVRLVRALDFGGDTLWRYEPIS